MKNISPSRVSILLTIMICAAAALSFLTGADDTLALAAYSPTNDFAWQVREWSNVPLLLVSFSFLGFLIIPYLRDKSPELRQVAVVWVLTAFLGTGLINQVLVKQWVERPRPREDVLVQLNDTQTFSGKYVTTAPTVALKGKSMPSGHAGVAFLLLIPVFPLWKRRRKLALTFLASGIIYGGIVSWARMSLGAHYLSDVLIAAAINIAAAGLFAHLIKPTTRVRTIYPLSFVILACSIFILTKTVHTTLTWEGTLQQKPVFELPCAPDIAPDITFPARAKFTVDVKGKGYPETSIYMKKDKNTFRLKRFGIHHKLSCTAKMTIS